MHIQQRQFCERVRAMFPHLFINVRVLDIGSMDINGNNRYLFQNAQYIGVDVGPGRNVDVVASGHEFTSEQPFDFVISTECLEHNVYWRETFANAYQLTKPGGMIIFTAAGVDRPEHGTRRSEPMSSPHTNDYYMNITATGMASILGVDLEYKFRRFAIEYDRTNQDIYFWGIKN